jgi:hypothetical protein
MKLAVVWVVALCSLVELYQTTQRYSPEDSHLNTQYALYIKCTSGNSQRNTGVNLLLRHSMDKVFACSVFTQHLAIFSLVFLYLSFLKFCTEVLFSVILCFAFYLHVGTSCYDIAQLYHLQYIYILVVN